jgi:hypothetical protein
LFFLDTGGFTAEDGGSRERGEERMIDGRRM